MAAMASSSTSNDPNWYRAIDHIIEELERLTMQDRYNGIDHIRVANGAGMEIMHIGKSFLPNSTCPLYLHNVFPVPHTHNHLVSIHHFNLDNHTFIKLHLFFFLIKDRAMRKVAPVRTM
jgi:hypothetical protein